MDQSVVNKDSLRRVCGTIKTLQLTYLFLFRFFSFSRRECGFCSRNTDLSKTGILKLWLKKTQTPSFFYQLFENRSEIENSNFLCHRLFSDVCKFAAKLLIYPNIVLRLSTKSRAIHFPYLFVDNSYISTNRIIHTFITQNMRKTFNKVLRKIAEKCSKEDMNIVQCIVLMSTNRVR